MDVVVVVLYASVTVCRCLHTGRLAHLRVVWLPNPDYCVKKVCERSQGQRERGITDNV